MKNEFDRDDEYADRWDYESDRYLDVFENFLMRFPDDNEHPDWDLADEPDAVFMAISDANAELFLLDMNGDE